MKKNCDENTVKNWTAAKNAIEKITDIGTNIADAIMSESSGLKAAETCLASATAIVDNLIDKYGDSQTKEKWTKVKATVEKH